MTSEITARPTLREKPERLAWIVLLASFAVFVVLAIAIPLVVSYSLENITTRLDGAIDPSQGTLLLYTPAAAEPIAITALRKEIPEGSTIEAAGNSTQATLRLINDEKAEEVQGSVQIYGDTVLTVDRMQRPLFEMSSAPFRVKLTLQQGQMRIFTNTGLARPLAVEIDTPHGAILLETGSYQIVVTPDQTDVIASNGSATLKKGPDGVLVVTDGLRAWMTNSSMSGAPEPASQNLLRNGNFTEPMLNSWSSYVIAQNVTPGKVSIIERDGRRVAYFVRQGEDNVPTEVGISQDIGKDVNVYDKLFLQLDVKLLFQSLPGAGYLSSEFPMRVEIEYTDIYGKEGLTWGHGFYYRDPENENWQVVNGQKIPAFNWYTYRSPNLMELLQETRPARIDRVRVYASGWNYQSMVSEVLLTAE